MDTLSALRGLSVCALLVASTPAIACGDSMFRVGFGMEIPAGSVQQPANIVIFKASDSSPDVFFNDDKVSAKLGKAGHHVSRVEAGSASTVQGANVVIARADELDRARSALGAQMGNAVFLPVTEGFTKSVGGTELSLSANATLQQILSVLQRAMQAAMN
jgi:hypothetical protein